MLLGQAVFGGWLSARGWFYQDDLSALDEASGRRLGWGFLTMPVNDHLVPGYRFVFWLQRHTDPLNYTQTVLVRIVLQTLAIALLARLLVLLFGRRPEVLVVTGLYAINPLILGNLTWLTTAACLVPAEIAAIVALDSHIRYTLTGRLRWATAAGISLLAGMCFWEKTAIIGIMLPVLSLGFLTTGGFGHRLRELLRRWPGWLVTAAPPLLFVGYFFAHHYGGSAHGVRVSDMVSVVRTGWLKMAVPALFGGPWHWFDNGTAYVSWSAPSTTAIWLSELGFIALVLVGLRRTGARSLLGWSLPALSVAIGTVVVAVGRYFAFGDLIAITMRYSFDFALALALGAALALIPSDPQAMRERLPGAPAAAARVPAPRTTQAPRLVRALVPATVALLLVSSTFSNVRFEDRWVANPTKPYVDRLLANIARAGPGVNLYDTSVSSTVVPYFFGPTMHLSTLLSWTAARARFDQTDTQPLLVDQQGNLVAANLLPAARGVLPKGAICQTLVQGVGTWRIPLDHRLPYGDGFLHLEYFQQHPSTLSVFIEDASGALVPPAAGSRVAFPVTLGAQLLRLRQAEAAAIVITSDSPAANICIGGAVIGAPFAPAK
ncbi:MAG TPA: hypothetical protein VHO01_08720 [Jatrophihabitans sp.]|nr:hypothetical protein [Jatrophihabitans sp.]